TSAALAVDVVPDRVALRVVPATASLATTTTAPPVRISLGVRPATVSLGALAAEAAPVRLGVRVIAGVGTQAGQEVGFAPPVRVALATVTASASLGTLAPSGVPDRLALRVRPATVALGAVSAPAVPVRL